MYNCHWGKRLLTVRPGASVSLVPSIPAPGEMPHLFSAPAECRSELDQGFPTLDAPWTTDFLLTVSPPQFPARVVPGMRCALRSRFPPRHQGAVVDEVEPPTLLGVHIQSTKNEKPRYLPCPQNINIPLGLAELGGGGPRQEVGSTGTPRVSPSSFPNIHYICSSPDSPWPLLLP